ncbi:MAG: NTP transferase domain-containing protein [Patescibacteria group bacterium]|jgi:bifunctional UDP-N-acetylglucosamine pyrophosphorylase/glucosamine-1-phosphate N-acetyltransferase
MIVGVILAAGKGTRMNSSEVNKTSLLFNGKPLVQYGIDLYKGVVDKTVIVVGSFAESVKAVVHEPEVMFVDQIDMLGTGDAVRVAVEEIARRDLHPQSVLVGYGDHMMFYSQNTVKRLVEEQQNRHAALSLVTSDYDRTDEMRFGRIVRDEAGFVKAIVEHKDASADERKITEFNPGLYCFDFDFLAQNIMRLKNSPSSGEFYLTDLVSDAVKLGMKVVPLHVPFSEIGLGVNTTQELSESQKLYQQNHS